MSEKVIHIFSAKVRDDASVNDINQFIKATAEMLPQIEGVSNFRIYESLENKNVFFIYMEFACYERYEHYKEHPIHHNYVVDVWNKVAGDVEVYDMKEINIEQL